LRIQCGLLLRQENFRELRQCNHGGHIQSRVVARLQAAAARA
jgi:hypothetical protein